MTNKAPSRYSDLGPLHDLLLRACPPDSTGRRSIMVLADKLGRSHQSVYKWISSGRIPPRQVKDLVKISQGRVSREEFLEYVL